MSSSVVRQAYLSRRFLRAQSDSLYPFLPVLQLADLFEFHLQEFGERLDDPLMHALDQFLDFIRTLPL